MKYPVVIPYKKTQDDGQELKLTLRSLNNLDGWNGEVYILGDRERWFSDKIHHIRVNRRSHNPYQDAEYKIREYLLRPDTPDDFIFSNDDIIILYPTKLEYLHQNELTGAGNGYHNRQKEYTMKWLKEHKHTYLNYDLHVPMLMNKAKRLKVSDIISARMEGVSLKPRSVYGNIFKVGGEFYRDQKIRGLEIPDAPIISTAQNVPELFDVFDEPSEFEKESNGNYIAVVTHFSPADTRTGMVMFLDNLLCEIKKAKPDMSIDVFAVRGKRQFINREGILYQPGRIRNQDLSEYNKVVCLSPHYIRHRNLITLTDTIKYLNTYNDPRRQFAKLNIYSTKHIKKEHGDKGLVLHPIVYPKQHKTKKGDKITLVGMSEPKGLNVFLELVKRNPELQFLGVRSGWQKDRQPKDFNLPNLEIIDEVTDMRKVWNKTKIMVQASYEQYGLANLEAMINGIPCIVFDCAGTREALGDAGIYIKDKNDAEAYNNALHELLDDKTYIESSKRAKAHAEAQVALNREQIKEVVKELTK